jgi:hypothetical protein
VLSAIFFSAGAIAQNQPLACLSDARAGLSWENGRWEVSSFVSKKFILVQTKDGFTNESAAKALGASASNVQCRSSNFNEIICNDTSGGFLMYRTKNLKGGIAQLLGTTLTSDERDTPTLTAFSCTPF